MESRGRAKSHMGIFFFTPDLMDVRGGYVKKEEV